MVREERLELIEYGGLHQCPGKYPRIRSHGIQGWLEPLGHVELGTGGNPKGSGAPGVRYQERGEYMRKYLVTEDWFDGDGPWKVKLCPGCDEHFKAGQYVTLVPIGPGADVEERIKAHEGRPYDAVSVPAHWACVTGESDSYIEELIVRSVTLEVEEVEDE